MAARPAPDLLRLREQASGGDIDFRLEILAGREDHGPVVIEEQGRIDAPLGEQNRVGPRARWIGGRNKKIPALSHVRRDHEKPPIVISQGGSIDAARAPDVFQIEL